MRMNRRKSMRYWMEEMSTKIRFAGSVRRKGRSGRSEYLDLEEDHSQSGGNEREIGHDFVNSHQPFTPQNGEQAFQHLSSKVPESEGQVLSNILQLKHFPLAFNFGLLDIMLGFSINIAPDDRWPMAIKTAMNLEQY
ncbi:hypothetical protein SDJN03_07442, partial [Cucurbita argyrosperma subsp. sororia]